MRGVTASDKPLCVALFISTHTPHARRDSFVFDGAEERGISTHTPHARRDATLGYFPSIILDFNSHASCEA